MAPDPSAVAGLAYAMLTKHRQGDIKLTRKAGSFLGQLVCEPAPLTAAQADWFATLQRRAGLVDDEQREAA
ncbi:hypothetical protein [Sphingomonas sp.]|uniref:hypothetical protein n=1 Tax=Sphingomonas sp. TaxID=28214 RepID=UPI003BACB340